MTAIINPPVRRAEATERWTHEDFMLLAPEDKKAELIDGEIIVTPPPFDEHERLQTFLIQVIGIFVSRFHLGEVRGPRTAVYISEDQTYEPDVLFVSRERAPIITRRKLTAAPDLVIEILSAATVRYDRGTKLSNYAKAGVRELWLIDPYGPEGTQFFQKQGDDLIEVAPTEGVIHFITLPNFKLKTSWLWPNAEGALPNPYEVLNELGVF